MYFIAVWIPRYICGQCHNGMLLRATVEYVALAGLHEYMLFMELLYVHEEAQPNALVNYA